MKSSSAFNSGLTWFENVILAVCLAAVLGVAITVFRSQAKSADRPIPDRNRPVANAVSPALALADITAEKPKAIEQAEHSSLARQSSSVSGERATARQLISDICRRDGLTPIFIGDDFWDQQDINFSFNAATIPLETVADVLGVLVARGDEELRLFAPSARVSEDVSLPWLNDPGADRSVAESAELLDCLLEADPKATFESHGHAVRITTAARHIPALRAFVRKFTERWKAKTQQTIPH